MTTRKFLSFLLVFGVLTGIILGGSPLAGFFHLGAATIVFGTVIGGILLSHTPADIRSGLRSYIGSEPLDAAQAESSARLFSSLAGLSMSGGLLGILIGLVALFQNLEDPTTIGPAMCVSLLSLFYGVILSEFVFRPAAADCTRRLAQSPASSAPEIS
jgi:flagellar motor component MotA